MKKILSFLLQRKTESAFHIFYFRHKITTLQPYTQIFRQQNSNFLNFFAFFHILLLFSPSFLHFFQTTEGFFLSPFNKVFSVAPLYRLLRFAHGFVFAPQNFFIGWGRLTPCIAGHAIQRKNPQDESQRFSKWR